MYCHKPFGEIHWHDHPPALVDYERKTVEWDEIPLKSCRKRWGHTCPSAGAATLPENVSTGASRTGSGSSRALEQGEIGVQGGRRTAVTCQLRRENYILRWTWNRWSDHAMLITKMRSRECRDMFVRLGFGRLACVSNNRPYIVPIYFSYDADCLYCFSTLGRKIEWMRENPLVCVEVDEIRAHDNWVSVVAFGHYVEISNAREDAKGREYVRSLLQKRSLWWQSGMRHPRFAANRNLQSRCSIAS